MYFRCFLIILLMNFPKLATCIPDNVRTLKERQKQLLNSFNPCVIWMVYLEHSISASSTVHIYLNYCENQATFILESIPADLKRYYIDSLLSLRSKQDLKFPNCYKIFYFQDQMLKVNNSISYLSSFLLICEYFKQITINLRNENPTYIVFITLQSIFSSSGYDCLNKIDTTSLFYCLSRDTVERVFINSRNPMPVYSNILWDKSSKVSFHMCEVSLDRVID